jgi:eukaryotic-like serine/threonine-protein kinase
MLTSGAKVGPYEILSPLGAGGMGEVYRAHDTKLGRDVALKVLPVAFAANVERLARFRREAQVLASLNHPGIAAIYGLEESEGVLALVMELVEGPTLAERIAQGPMPLEDALPITRQIAEALEYAHERGVVHRDLKPANVKITGEGNAKVLDFGLAKALDSQDSPSNVNLTNSPTVSIGPTHAGMILGTAAYMSPEQAKGRPVDRRADIWAFGCVLYEMLTGEKAFNGETVSDVLASVIMKEPDWARLPSKSPATVKKLLRRCLDKDPKRRLRDIGEARVSIEEYLGNPAAETPEPAVQAARPTSKGWLVGLSLTGIFFGAIVAGLLVWKLASGRPAFPMHFSAVTNFPGVEAQPSLSPDGRSVAFASNRDGHYDIYVGLIAGGSLVRITNDSNLKARPRWSPDGTKIAYSRLNESGLWDIWEVPALGGTPRRLILNAMDPAWSPDGRSLAYANNSTGSIWIADSSGQNARAITQPQLPWAEFDPSFSPDGRRLAFVFQTGGPYGELEVANLATNKVYRLTDDHALALSPAWSPDSRIVYFASGRGGALNIWKIAASGGEPDQITAGQGQDAELDVSSDGKRIVFSTYRDNINIAEVRLESGGGETRPKWLTTDPARNAFMPAYSPDGKHVAYFSNRHGVEREIIWVMDSDGSNPVPLVEDGRMNIFPRWAPDGQTVFYTRSSPGSPLEVCSTAIVGSAPQILPVKADGGDLDVGPDGRVLFGAPQGRYQAFNPANNQTQTLITLPGGQQSVLPRWSPDGRSISYLVLPRQQNDPSAGLWVDDLKNPPRQLFRGWVAWYTWARSGSIYLLEGKPDLSGILWRLDSDGQRLGSTSANIRLNYNYWLRHLGQPFNFFDASPDGRRIAIGVQQVYEADIGMIEGLR